MDSRHCEFYLTGVGYFHIPVNTLEITSGMKLSYLEKLDHWGPS